MPALVRREAGLSGRDLDQLVECPTRSSVGRNEPLYVWAARQGLTRRKQLEIDRWLFEYVKITRIVKSRKQQFFVCFPSFLIVMRPAQFVRYVFDDLPARDGPSFDNYAGSF